MKGPVAGTARKALGTDPDLEKLARKFRKAGGTVEFVGRNHLLWTLPNGFTYRSGLTMSQRNIRVACQTLTRALEMA